MTERVDDPAGLDPEGLSSEALGRVFRELSEEHADNCAEQNDDTFAMIERRTRGAAFRAPVVKRGRKAAYFGGAAALVAAALFAYQVSVSEDAVPTEMAGISYSVDGASERGVADEGDVIASEGKAVVITFSDQSRMKLAPHSTVRIEREAGSNAVGGTGRVVARLAQGEVNVALTESEEASYSFEAGQYKLHGMGSSFLFAYVPNAESLEVKGFEGKVFVEDPKSGRHEVGSGERLRLPKNPESAGETSATTSPSRADREVDVHPKAVRAPTEPDFQTLAKEGRFAEIVASAEKQGLDRVLSGHSASDLQQLGQAARYVGNPALAERVWTTMISRFSGSTAGRSAQFFLGRLYEQQGRTGEALDRYGAYLAQAGAGAYTMDALGRKLLLVKKTRGADSARPIAREYLRRFPQGPYAQAAAELAGGE